jgi:hypothetical protein
LLTPLFKKRSVIGETVSGVQGLNSIIESRKDETMAEIPSITHLRQRDIEMNLKKIQIFNYILYSYDPDVDRRIILRSSGSGKGLWGLDGAGSG